MIPAINNEIPNHMPAIVSMKILHQSALVVVLGSLFVSPALAANLITNPGFESPSVGGSYASYGTGSTSITGWTVDTTPADGVQIGGAGVLVPSNGSQNLQLTGGPGNTYSAGGGVHQTIATTSNQLYNISIDVASRQNNSVTGKFSFGGQNHVLTATRTNFATLTWSVTATNTNPVIDITGSSSSSTAQLIIDNVSVTVPAGPVNAGTSTVAASPNSIPADGATTSTITVSLQDAGGNPVPGKTVTLASSRGAADTISAASGPSSASGTVTFTVRSTTTGTAVFSATDATDSLALNSTAAVFVYAVGSKGPQASPIPLVFDQTATNDNLVVLMAAASEYSSDLTLYQDGPSAYPKHFWINNWSNGTNDYFKWNVALATGAVYHVYAKLSAGAVVPVQLSITGTNTVLNFNTRSIGWDKLDCGTISIPGGTNQLVLRKNTTDTSQVISIKSLELIRQSDLPAYQQRVASFRADTTWLSQSKYGLMTQFGAWGYPPTGAQPSLQNMANGFSVSNFVNLVTNTGCKYVIFSLTWWTYQMLAPIQAVTNIVPGNTNLTSTRDVIGELSTALHAAGVRFTLYYHCGSDSQSPGGYDSTPWWQAQQFPEPGYTERGVGDRSIFLTNWCNVISEVGNRYGTNLDGWFIDDGLVYYPAPFEHLGQAARAGNPNRLICYNPWIAAEYTDFQDVFMGENSQGQSQFGSAPNGGNGIFTDGPQVGLLQHGMFTMEQDWGIYQANQPITTQITASQAIGWVQSASALGVPLSFNMMLWSDQTYSTNSLNVLLNLKSAIYGGSSASLSPNNLVANGTFESPTVASGATLLAAGSTALTGWTVDATPSDGVQLGAAGTFGPNNGSQNVQLTGGSTYAAGGGISQTIATTPGATYTIIIDVASRQSNAVTGNFNFGGNNHVLNASSAFFTTLTWKVVATSSNTLIDITGYTNSASGQLLIDNVSVTLFSDPSITTQPVSQLTTVGGTASFIVTAGGTAPFGYQWQATNSATGGFTNLMNGGNISGATSNVLTIANVAVNGPLAYQVIVTNSVGAITSSVASLTILPANFLVNVQYLGSNINPSNPTNAFSGASGTWVGPGTAYSGAAVLGSSGDTWNQEPIGYYYNQSPNPYFNGVSLVNSANSPSGLTLTLGYQSIGQGAALAGTATDAATTNLMQSSIFIFTWAGGSGAGNAQTTHTIGGLSGYAGSKANLVVYAGAPSARPEQIAITGGASGGNSGSTLTTSSTSRSISAGAGVACQIFTNLTLTGSNLVFTVNETGSAANANAGYVNGFQLQVSAPTPPASTNAWLTALALSPAGILSPAFASNTFVYYATNAYGATPSVTVTNADLTATNQLIYNGTTNGLASGQPSAPLALTYGVTNVVKVKVMAQDGMTVQTYTVNVLLAAPPASTNAFLTSLVLNPALTFTQAFVSNVLSYAAAETYGSVPVVMVTNADLTATNQLIYNGATNGLASGATSSLPVLNLMMGLTNVVQVQVTAPDGVTMQTYTVNVTQLPNQSTQPGLTNSVSNGTLNLTWGPDCLGYRLLMQTNNLNQGVSGNTNDWGTVPGSTATNTMAIPIAMTNLNEYYRLVYP
jgi:hypothetical protein